MLSERRIKETRYDVIILGAGLSGITAGLSLQQHGLKVAILERSHRIGGLCGTFSLDGYHFVIACNDFGKGMEQVLKELNVPVEFHKPVTLVFHNNRQYRIPPKAKDLLRGWRLAPQVFRYVWRVIRNNKIEENEYLEQLINKTINEKSLNNLLKLPAYFMGVRPTEFKTEDLKNEYIYKYGYSEPTTPAGGPQILIENMATTFQVNGDIYLNTEAQAVETDGNYKRIKTSSGSLSTREVIMATGEGLESRNYKPGMPLSMFLLAISKTFVYPEGVHTIAHFPKDPEKWLGALDEGLCPDEFGFHIFSSDLPDQGEYYTANIYFYMPRDALDPDNRTIQHFEKYIFHHLELMLPGVTNAIVYKRFISAGEFTRLHGFSSRVMPRIIPSGTKKPENFDKNSDLFFAGNAIYPPGDHAGAALLSATNAANLVISTKFNAK